METLNIFNEETEENSIFEFHQSYTSMDEDYENHIIIGAVINETTFVTEGTINNNTLNI